MTITIEAGSEWVDKKGDVVKVLSLDCEEGLITFTWPNNKKRPTERTISIDKFVSRVTPHGSQLESVKEKPSKSVQVRKVWIDELPSNFGKSPNLQLSNQDWLERGMHAKTVKFNIGAGGLPPEVNWEDHCAAIAIIKDGPAKALASILLWGSDTNWDWSRQFNEVVQHLADNMIERCNKDGRVAPQACRHTLHELARLMARMVLHFELYELWDVYTVKGRLQFSGIEVNVNTYSHAWLTYQRHMTNDLFDMVVIADHCVSDYRQQLARSH